MNNDIKTLIPLLLADGWKEYKDGRHPLSTHNLYKRFDTPTRCACNDDKKGMQVTIHLYPAGRYPNLTTVPESMEMEIAGQLPDESWYKVHAWCLDPISLETVNKTIPRLLAGWESIK